MPAGRRWTGRAASWCTLGLGLCCLFGGGAPLLASVGEPHGVQDAGAIPLVQGVVPGGAATAAGVGGAAASRGSAAATRVGAGLQVRARPTKPAAAPVRLQIPRLHIDASVVAVAADPDGALAVPEDPSVTGWWDASARPGAQSGSAVLDGHVDSATGGLGAFFKLGEARPGDRVVVLSSSGASIGYRVVARRRYSKAALPVQEIFGQTSAPRLVLVTCGGAFDRATGSYLDNVVLYAVPQ